VTILILILFFGGAKAQTSGLLSPFPESGYNKGIAVRGSHKRVSRVCQTDPLPFLLLRQW
jgi:hypothetical protein